MTGRHHTARAAPGGEEVDEHRGLRLEHLRLELVSRFDYLSHDILLNGCSYSAEWAELALARIGWDPLPPGILAKALPTRRRVKGLTRNRGTDGR